jgi:hypothetical protein
MLNVLQSTSTKDLASNILIFLLYLLILTFVLRYLWNTILVKYISVFRPIGTLLDTLLLSLAFTMFKM